MRLSLHRRAVPGGEVGAGLVGGLAEIHEVFSGELDSSHLRRAETTLSSPHCKTSSGANFPSPTVITRPVRVGRGVRVESRSISLLPATTRG